jgi:hypothetical protein
MAFKNKLGTFVNKMQNKLFKNVSSISTSNGILHNKVLLYVVFIFALLNLFLFANTGNYTSVVVFLLIGFLTSFFSKNMLVILLLSLILTNILKYGSSLSEGFEEGVKDKGEDDEGFEEGAKDKGEDDEGFEEGAKDKGEDDEGFEEDAKKKKKGIDDEGFEEGAKDKESAKDKEGLEDLKEYAEKLLNTISSLNKQIDKFSKMS